MKFKINNKIILFIYLFFMTIIVIKYIDVIDFYFGGLDDCLICTKVHFNGYLTNWSISHYITFLIAGYISPESVYIIILAGVLWEIVELILEYTSKTNHDSFLCSTRILKYCKIKMTNEEFWHHYFGIKEHKDTKFIWSSGGFLGALLDIIINTLGVYSGIYIHNLVYK
jgi:hypothetical protein